MKIEAARKDKELELEKSKLQAAQREKDKEMEMEKLKIEARVELKKSRPIPLHIPGGPKRKVHFLGVPSFHTLTNMRIRWIAISLGSKVMPFQINGTRLCGHHT